MTRDRTYGTSQPRTLRCISSSFHSRLSGGVSGPGTELSQKPEGVHDTDLPDQDIRGFLVNLH